MTLRNSALPTNARPSVHVAGGAGPYQNARTALTAIDLQPLRGRRVLLKPNAGRVAAVGTGITTNPEVVAATIDAMQDVGAEVAIGESPIMGVDVLEAFEAGGIAEVARQRDCPLIDMDRRPAVEVTVPDGRAIQSLKVCSEATEFDCVVSIPVMKMHMHTGVTLAVKNMKGCLWRRSKVKLHMLPPVEGSDHKPIDIAIADMASVLRADLAVIDGTVGMEGLGPSAGTPKPLDVVVASTNSFAADAVACRLMGTDAARIPHLNIAAERGYGIIDLDRVDVAPSTWQQWIAPFALPPENLAIEFPDITVLDNNSCSACQSTLMLFLMRHRGRLFDYFADQAVRVAIGKGHTELPPQTLCLGNCTARHKDVGLFVPGCPPVGSQILAALSGEPTAEDSNPADSADPEEP